jgi:hypothetical protein
MSSIGQRSVSDGRIQERERIEEMVENAKLIKALDATSR